MGRRDRLEVGPWLLCAVQFVDVLGVTSATTAIPAIAAELSAGPVAVIAIAAAYATFFGGFLVVGARIGDRFGHRRILIGGLVLFAAVAVVGATATAPVQVIVARAWQGFTAAISIPSALRLLLHLTPTPKRRTAAIAAWSAAGAAAGAVGFLLGGLVTDLWSWRGIFWVNLPVGLVLAALLGRILRGPPPAAGHKVRLDLPGAALLAGSVMLLVGGAALAEHHDTRLIGAAAAGLGLISALLFVRYQRSRPDALIPREAFGSANLWVGTVLSFVNTATTSSSAVVLTFHLQQQREATALQAGLQLLPLSVAVVIGSAAAKPLSQHWTQPRLAALGLAVITAGNAILVLALVVSQSPTVGFIAGTILIGLGLGVASVAATTIGTDVPETLTGTASGVINTAAQLGTAIGIATSLALSAAITPQPNGTITAWTAIAALAALTAGAILLKGPAVLYDTPRAQRQT